MLDRTNVFPGGVTVCPADILSLKPLVDTELSNGMKLTDLHFHVKGQDRQIVSLARQLLSEDVAALLTTNFPDDPAKEALSNLIKVASKCFDILNSEDYNQSDKLGSPFGMYLEEQIPYLRELEYLMGNIDFGGFPRFNKGIIIAINGTIQLHKDLDTLYCIPHLKTRRITQDALERFFSTLKSKGLF